jgi:SAM-dependent methyltransferase
MEPIDERSRRWDAAYVARGSRELSWYQVTPRVSLELIDLLGVHPETAVIDVGGGASTVVDRLVERGFCDVAVLDVSTAALDEVRGRLGRMAGVRLVQEDVLSWRPGRRFGLWHDRALFHFLVDPADRAGYLRTLLSAVEPGGLVVLATFAADGPERCSGLPVRRYSVGALAAELGGRFELLAARREEHVTPRGAIQPFTWVAGRLRSSA